ncbi:MAG: flavocytochrome c [Sedimentibacter sp.]|jgi:flavocytochrome c|nr:flavocytochrome c [Sedimentibacter sp.]
MKKFLSILLCFLMVFSLASCSAAKPAESESKEVVEEAKSLYKAGTYEATVKGHNGNIKVAVTVSENKIEKVAVLENRETSGIGSKPLEVIPAVVVEGQTLEVDTLTGATISSMAVLSAVEDCLNQAGADVAALKANGPEKAAPQKIEKSADVVIVGGGGAGLAAAVSASDAGASVIVVEKLASVGGNTLVCGGIYNCPDPELQEPEGIEDSVEFYTKQTWEGGDKVGNLDLVKVLCGNAYDGYQWLKSLGVEFKNQISQGAGSLYRRTHSSVDIMGTGYINTYMKNLEAKGDKVEILTETKGESLIMDGKKVVGVIATDKNGNEYTIKANKNVIITTGGFAGNVEMRQEYNTSGKWADLGPSVLNTNTSGITGDGIYMAKEAGANLVDMEQIQLLYLGNPKTGKMLGYTPRGLSGTDKIMFVNKEGNRFVREDGRRDEICSAILAQTGGMMYIVESADDNAPSIVEGKTTDGTPFKDAEANGDIFIADTIAELAEKIGANPENLQNTFDKFNASVESGTDEFGRTLFSVKLQTGPFIATPRVPAVHHTMGGIQIDTECHVLNTDGEIIEGLLAAGEVTGGIHGANRLGGNAVVDTVVFGKLAGEVASR